MAVPFGVAKQELMIAGLDDAAAGDDFSHIDDGSGPSRAVRDGPLPVRVLADRWVLDDDHSLVDRLRVSVVDVERGAGAVVIDRRYAVRDRPMGGAVPHHHAQPARAGLAAGALPGGAAVVAVQHEPDTLPGDPFGGALDGDLAVRGDHQPVQVLWLRRFRLAAGGRAKVTAPSGTVADR